MPDTRESSPSPPSAPLANDRRGVVAWCLFDWANSAYVTVVLTFVFATYFSTSVAPNSISGTSLWGWTIGLSGIIIALASPVLGAIADKAGPRKPWIAVFTLMCALATAALWLVEPDPAFVPLALILIVISNFGFEMSTVFTNAMLPTLVSRKNLGRLSGWGWGIGYLGGLSSLALCLGGLVLADQSWFGISHENAENIRATSVVTALWFVVFALPLFLLTPDEPHHNVSYRQAVRDGLTSLRQTLRNVRHYKPMIRFLIARMLYADGLVTLFAFGGIYAGGTFGMSITEIMVFGIAINLTAGLGAIVFARWDDRIGPRATILLSLVCLIVLSGALLVVQTKFLFWLFGLPLGLFVGPLQAASRTFMAHLAPPHLRTEYFGLMAFSGKATAFAGPTLLALVSSALQSQRAGLTTILLFFIGGAILMARLPDPRTSSSDEHSL